MKKFIDKFKIYPYVAGFLAGFAVLGAGFILDKSEQQRFEKEVRINTWREASTVRARLEGSLNSKFSIIQGLVTQFEVWPEKNQQEFEQLAKEIVRKDSGILNLVLVKDTVIIASYPDINNKKLIGANFKDFPHQWPLVAKLIQTKQPVVAGPLNMIQGGEGIIIRVPILLQQQLDPNQNNSYWGMISIVINPQNLYQQANLIPPRNDFKYALRGKNGLGDKGEVFFGDPTLFQKEPLLLNIEVINNAKDIFWQLAVIPEGGFSESYPLRKWVILGSGLLAALTGLSIFKLCMEPMKLRQAINRALSDLQKKETEYRDLVENANSLIMKTDTQGNITFFNQFAQQFFGYSENKILGKNIVGTIISANNYNSSYKNNPEKYLENEHQIVVENEETAWISWRVKRLVDKEENLSGILAIGRDITERKKAEQNLQEANEFLEKRVYERTQELEQEIAERKETEAELKEAQMRWNLVLQGTNDAIWDWDLTTNKVFYSPRWKEMLGYSDEETTNDTEIGFNLVHPDDLQCLNTEIQDYLQRKVPLFYTEFRLRHKSGFYLWFLVRAQALWNEAGEAIRLVGSNTDITERKLAEDALRESEAKFQRLSANVPGILYQCVLYPDGSFGVLYMASACRSIFGLEPEEFYQNSALIFDMILPEDREEFYKSIAISAQTMEPWEWESMFELPSGERRWFRAVSRPTSKENGDIIWDGIMIDTHEMKQVLLKLKESQERWQLAVQASNDGIWDLNLQTGEAFYSERLKTMLGYSESEFPNDPIAFLSYIHPEDKERLVSTSNNKIANKESYIVMEFRMRCKGGFYKWILSRGQALWDEEGRPVRMLGSYTDIQESKEAEEMLRQSEAREREKSHQLEEALHKLKSTQAQLVQTEKMSSLGELVAGIAHEINNPVNFIHGNITYINEYIDTVLELLNLYQKNYPHPEPEIQEFLEIEEIDFIVEDLRKILQSMTMGTKRIRDIVLSLRNFARLDEAELKKVDIHEGIESTLLILQNRLKNSKFSAGIQVIKDYGNLPLIECYPGPLNQVFMNIIANGIDAIDQKNRALTKLENKEKSGEIKISTKMLDCQQVVVEIKDNGAGIPQENVEKIFNPFYTTKPVGKGTGLGLSISYQIVVEKHKGKLQCFSEVGRGTTFQILLPVKF